jgi:hypothetical protein
MGGSGRGTRRGRCGVGAGVGAVCCRRIATLTGAGGTWRPLTGASGARSSDDAAAVATGGGAAACDGRAAAIAGDAGSRPRRAPSVGGCVGAAAGATGDASVEARAPSTGGEDGSGAELGGATVGSA